MSKRKAKNRMPRIGFYPEQRRAANKAKPAPVIVKKVVLPPAGVVEVVVPKGVIPAVVTDPSKGVVTIVPVPAAKLAAKTWWQRTFG